MNNFLDKSKQLKIEATELLRRGKVVETLKPFGEVVLKGSFALDLMTVEDIDISVINPNANLKKNAIEALNKFANEGFFQSCHLYNWVDYNKSEFPKGYYLGLQIPINEKKWKIDIWFINEETEYEKIIIPQLKNLTVEKRELILKLKQYRNENKIDIGSADIYRLVLKGKLKSVEDLKKPVS